MLRIVEESLKAVTPHLLGAGAVDWLPDPDPQESVDFLADWLESGISEFRVLTTLAFLTLNLCSLATERHLFPNLGPEARERLIERLFKRRGLLSFLFAYLLGSPAISAYYSRVDVQVKLGFDIPALREEAKLRGVTRGEEALPDKETGAGTADGGDAP